MTTTHTYAVMEVLSPTYEEVRTKLLAAGYKHAVDDDQMHLDMHGIALTPAETAPPERGSTVAELQEYIKQWSKDKGWFDDRSIGDLIALMHSELSEALEEHRNGHEPAAVRVVAGKPEGIPIELADAVIRIISFCSRFDINLADAIDQKMAYNETRPHRHGGKVI